ncbi:MAG TPA: hypothetical protein VGH28_23525 [Polyangiaceae bacterium]|jgi:hypothetical protein
MRSLRWTLPLASTFSLFAASSAWATATIQFTSTPPVVTRVDTTGADYGCPARHSPSNSCIVDGTSQGIGYPDCIDDTVLRFKSISMTGAPDSSSQAEIWAGTTDCTVAGATNNNSTATCWPLGTLQVQAAAQTVDIRVADIVSGLGEASPPPQTFVPGTGATSACNAARGASTTTTVTDDAGVSTTTAGVATVTVYFMIFAVGAGSAAPTSNVSYPVKVKLVGPNAVTNVTVGTGDGELILGWAPPIGDLTVQGFDLFAVADGTSLSSSQTTCVDASPGTEELDDAGNPVLDDAGNPIFVGGDDGGCTTSTASSTATCSEAGVGTVDVSSISCPTGGDAGDAGTPGVICEIEPGVSTAKGTISGLTNGTNYIATVAPYDEYGNAGQVAQAQCNSALPIDDFWKTYNQDGGNAYCSLAFVGRRGAPFAAALLGLIGMIWIRRRRR